MQNVNDDMDALMRKAGVDYPLFTGSADWSKVAAALEIKEEIPQTKRHFGKYLGLVLVCLLPWLLTQYDHNKGKTELAWGAGFKNEKAVYAEEITTNESDPAIIEKPVETNQSAAQHPNKTNSFRLASQPVMESQKLTGVVGVIPSKAAVAKNPEASLMETSNETETLPSQIISGKQPSETTPHLNQPGPAKSLAAKPGDPAAGTSDSKVVAADPLPVSSTVSPAITTRPRKKFYFGIVGGINVTSVKMQDVKQVGTDYGLIAGYNFMKGWSIEAGVLSSSKYYYSDGKYLDNPKIYLPPNSKINTVEGECRMLEIPMVVKYDFGYKKAHNWFATAGVSSFLMKKEDYSYDYYYLNTGTSYIYHKTYQNESQNWAAVMQLSAGYNHVIPLGLNLRIEPFVQIPLKGAGYGKLPLTSTGLRLGITRALF